ncbi:helix-turn-helix domain-containing protein [Dactylosporangium sp. NPDC005572]|uniref:helix-turn-helix domain-containing protein n=1 Tax=Dactylosporangium sp. NPDC005572 TaxID=3156889 RepID=UPI0033AFA85A
MDENPVISSLASETRVQELEPPFVSVKDAAVYLGKLSTREIYRLLESGDLLGAHHGRRQLVLVSSLKAFAEQLIETERATSEPVGASA